MSLKRILTCITPFVLIPFISAYQATGETVTWVTVEGTGSMVNAKKDEARVRALEDARFNAFHEAVLSGISAESLVVNFKLSGNLTGAIPYCRITDKKILNEGIERINIKGEDEPVPVYKVKIKAGVIQETESTSPEFSINSSLNKLRFTDGDTIHLNVQTTRDCYIAVFNIMENNKVIKLLPNTFKKNILISKKNPLSFPDEHDLKNGISLVAHIPDGKKSVTEMFYVLALNTPLALRESDIQEGIYHRYDGQTAFFSDLVKEVAGIPHNERAESIISYQIIK
ncbi:MAG: DUF4384 domain-containing protein [Nitrospiraceae bacterium]|nr:MAG: DUF4384 domain-containing protein [Nitrospiraceae bacterium]